MLEHLASILILVTVMAICSYSCNTTEPVFELTGSAVIAHDVTYIGIG